MPFLRALVCHTAASRYRHDFFRAVARLVDLQLFFCARPTFYGYQPAPASEETERSAVTHIQRHRFDPSFLPRLRTLNRQFKPDVAVIFEYSIVSLFSAWGWTQMPRPLTLWTDDSLQDCTRAIFARRLRRFLVLRAASIIVTCSRPAQAWYQQHFPEKKVYCVPILQEEEGFRSQLEQAQLRSHGLQASHGLRGRRVILFLGRLVREKDIGTLIAAMSHVAASALLVIVGAGPERRRLQRLAEKLGLKNRVIFGGEVRGCDVFAWYNLADLFVLPSVNERFGAVVNEALLAGIPTLCSAVAGASDLIRPGENGDTFTPRQPAALGHLINTWLARSTMPGDHLLLRPSLMPVTFAQSVAFFVEALNQR